MKEERQKENEQEGRGGIAHQYMDDTLSATRINCSTRRKPKVKRKNVAIGIENNAVRKEAIIVMGEERDINLRTSICVGGFDYWLFSCSLWHKYLAPNTLIPSIISDGFPTTECCPL